MAKSKKKKTKSRTRKVTAAPVERERSTFWPLAGAISLFLLALFLVLGGFETGGPLPINLFDGVEWSLGYAAYLAPLALVYFGVVKFKDDDRKVPFSKLFSMLTFLAAAAALMHTLFMTTEMNTVVSSGGNGGSIGAFLGNLSLTALDKIPASILFAVIGILMFFLSFNISLKILAKPFERREKDEDTDLEALKEKTGNRFKLNEGVPTVNSPVVPAPIEEKPLRLSSLKNTAHKMSAGETHEALTTASDPNWEFPSLKLLEQKQDKADAGDVEGNARTIQETFTNFNIHVEMEGANVGPRVTQYTLKPPTGVKLTKITALDNNLALDLAAHSIRIEAPIPGKRLVGVEVPNVKPAMVRMSGMLSSREWASVKSPLGFVIGRDIAGLPIVGDLAKMPHLLVAGQTGSGKSVMINDILTSLLYRNSPSDLKLILVDPKQVELAPYNGLPHLLTPVINEPEKCISALKWAVAEMERRLRTMAEVNKRNIIEYNELKQEEGMPYIVIVIDELADLMMMAARDVEALVVRLAQKARAAGIHLVLATQRPSVDVITGLIKANVPGRIAFTTQSQVDSRTIIDQVGAEKLLGRGDMLLLTSEMPKPKRVQAAFISDGETAKVVDFIKEQRPPQYDDEVVSQPVQLNGKGGIVADMDRGGEADDDLWRDAIRVIIEGRKASTSLLQRRLRVGYARAARLIENMEEQGIVGPADGARPREVLISSMDDVFGAPAGAEAGGGDVYDDMADDPKDD
ncbi:MAG: DNA translocase FtsK [Candidatus Saccharimonadales bacterium]